MTRGWTSKGWICVVAGLVAVVFVAGDIIMRFGFASTPVVRKSFQHVATDLREAPVIPTPPGSREIRIDVRVSVIPRGTALDDMARSQTLAAMNNRDCALLEKTIAGNCRIENSNLQEIRGGGATTFARYVIEPKSLPTIK